MKNLKKILLLLVYLSITFSTSAHDFEVDGIYYNINGNNATVTYRGTSSGQYSNEYTGAVNIPSTVTYNGTTYSVTSIGFRAFEVCRGLTSVTIPNSVTEIGGSAFSSCWGLTSVPIPNSVTSIGESAFNGCIGMTSVTIPNSVTSIGQSAFGGCDGLTSMVVESGNAEYDSRNNCNAIIETATNTLISGCKNTVIPNSVTEIGGSAFSSCWGLTSVTIPNSVTSIGDFAFHDCCDLTSVTIPNSVTTIGRLAFYDCSGLTEVTIPNSVSLIGERAFWRCTSLISVTIGNSVTEIPIDCFAECTGLTSVTIPNSVTSIGISAFYGCSGLASVTIPNSVTEIGGTAFLGCSGLTSVTIPNSVTSIGNYAFGECSSLASMVVDSGNTKYDSRNNCNAIIETATNTLISGCKNTVIPNSVTEIGGSAFDGCSGLTSVTIPNSVISIGDFAFYGCSGLTTVTMPNSVTSIGSSAFNGCTNLSSIYSKILAPENVSYGTSIFNGVSINYCMLYVPVGTLDSYQFTAPWNDFLNIIEYDYGPEFIMGDANGDGTIDVADYVDVASYILEQDPQPFYFAAADLDEDNSIDVGDLVGVAYLALNYESKAECIMHNAQLTNEAREEGKLACAIPCKEEKRNSECIMHDNEECTMGAVVQGNEVIINLSNNVDITAMQMDINLPQGMTLVDASLSYRASASHQVAFNQLANGDYRLLASSSALKCFKNNDGTVLTLTLAGNPDGNGCLRSIKLAAPSSTCYGINDIELNFTPTGVDNVTSAARIYSDGSNIIIDSPIDGTAQIVLPNGMNKTVKVATGRNEFETPTKGLIIVKMGNKVEKLQF